MIIDSHSHVFLPVEKHLEIMGNDGIDKTVLFPTIIHPEKTSMIILISLLALVPARQDLI